MKFYYLRNREASVDAENKRLTEWHDSFCWMPIVIENVVCWLEVVQRKGTRSYNHAIPYLVPMYDWEYKIPAFETFKALAEEYVEPAAAQEGPPQQGRAAEILNRIKKRGTAASLYQGKEYK